MNKILKNYLSLRTHLFPDDPKMTFLPFLVYVINKNRIFGGNYEQISKEFTNEFGFTLPYFILTDILQFLCDNNYCDKTTSQFDFNITKIDSLESIDDNEIDKYNEDVSRLVDNFYFYLNDSTLKRDEIEDIIISFIEENDFELLKNIEECKNPNEDRVLRMFWIEYLEECRIQQNKDWKTVLTMCEGSLIKSFIFDDVQPKGVFQDIEVFIDTPIVLRLLGYYGEYIKNEYEFLFSSWKNQGGKFFIFNHNYSECLRILRTAQDWVEERNIDLLKASDVCIFFREIGFTKEDVEIEINNFRENLHKYGISEYSADFSADAKNMIDAMQIRRLIKDRYTRNGEYPLYSSSLEDTIEVDAKSIVYSFFIRGDNNIHTFKDTKLIFLTSNKGIYYVARQYQKDNFGDTIPPLQLDSFIGKVICSSNIDFVSEVASKRIISHCHSAFLPSKKLKEAYSKKLDKMLSEKSITSEDYFLLKHAKVISEELVKKTKGNTQSLNNDTIYDFLNTVKTSLISDEMKKHTFELKKIQIESEEVIKRKEAEINRISEQTRIDKEKENELRRERYLSRVETTFNLLVHRWSISVYIASCIFLVLFLLLYIIKWVQNNQSDIVYLIINIILVFPFVINTLIWIKTKALQFPYVKKILAKQKSRIEESNKDIL